MSTKEPSSAVSSKVRVWEEQVEIPTYGTGKPDKNPMFLEKRVYQGSSGRVYPLPVIDKILDEKETKSYGMAILENEYVRVEIMPEIGGRIYRALDKTNNYDFVYYNRVIKPALVGLAGPWISGGIEFNWPQHHRPNTFGPVQHTITENEDGSATVWVSEIDRMYGTKVTTGFTLHPDKAYIEITAQLYNRTSEPQTFLWWANPAVAVNDHTQTVFPPDVTAVFDHGKRDVSRFPIATGTYYKMDYSEGVDISRYKNIPVPTSYMAYKSDYNFVGGYDHSVQAGLLHVANHHVSPGKKQWTWGNGEFGQAWDRSLTDEDGPYIELMTGVFTDNQPDFTWLQPYEEKSFTQYFMPYKNIGVVKNASIDAAVNLEVDETLRVATVMAYATSVFEGATIELKGRKRTYVDDRVTLSPESTYKTVITLDEGDQPHDLLLTVRNAEQSLLISYKPAKPSIEQIPDAAKPLPLPEELRSTEQLYLAGLHLEQYRHATFEPEAYYEEGLRRDASDIRLNVAYGTLMLRRGELEKAETHFRTAIESLTWRNPNPYDSEAYYQLGLALRLQERNEEAFKAFYKAVWSAAYQDSGYYALSQIACEKGAFWEALELVERALVRNTRNYKSRLLKTALLRKLDRHEEAIAFADETLTMDIADFGARYEKFMILEAMGKNEEAQLVRSELRRFMRDDAHNYLNLASDYTGCGLFAEAARVLEEICSIQNEKAYPMLHYTLAFVYDKMGQSETAEHERQLGSAAAPDYCFPNSLFELSVLLHTLDKNPSDSKAHYYLGNLYYDKKRAEDAIKHWETSVRLDQQFATAHRNLALAYYNKRNDAEASLQSLNRAFECNPNDARVFYELDQLHKKTGVPAQERLTKLQKHMNLVEHRDDLYLEYVTLLNTSGQHHEALSSLLSRRFHPWEGGEGKATGQYTLALVELAKQENKRQSYQDAVSLLQRALQYPENLGEGKLEGAQENNIHYELGIAYQGLGQQKEAVYHWTLASEGLEEPASAMYYNDQPPEMIFYQGLAWDRLNNSKEAKRRFNKLIDFAEKHWFDDVKIDYFAVSLPDFLVFEDDLNKRNQTHCLFMLGLGLLGLGHKEEAKKRFNEALQLEPNHQGAKIHLQLC
ncbi:tetratricopeptide repeat protein [Paenibacillus hubeiensis]|uniref:tetratricopeptide repeat protein n=1 Tax=Paenibacillus hubeiensis TaxID=3077330 RepID=UPI0031BB78E1